jgi:hypothetical protein
MRRKLTPVLLSAAAALSCFTCAHPMVAANYGHVVRPGHAAIRRRMAMSTDQQWREIAVGQLLVFSSLVELTRHQPRASTVRSANGAATVYWCAPITGCSSIRSRDIRTARTVRSSRKRSTANRLEWWPSIRPTGRASRRFISTT